MLREKYLVIKSDKTIDSQVDQEVRHLIRKDVDRTM